MSQINQFWREEDGQDLVEYSLLITFIAIACLALVGSGRTAVNGIWVQANSQISNAGSFANPS